MPKLLMQVSHTWKSIQKSQLIRTNEFVYKQRPALNCSLTTKDRFLRLHIETLRGVGTVSVSISRTTRLSSLLEHSQTWAGAVAVDSPRPALNLPRRLNDLVNTPRTPCTPRPRTLAPPRPLAPPGAGRDNLLLYCAHLLAEMGSALLTLCSLLWQYQNFKSFI